MAKKTNPRAPEMFTRRQMLRAKYTGGYFLFFRNYGKLMSKSEALFLQDLSNREQMLWEKKEGYKEDGKPKLAKKVKVEESGWYQCTTRFLLKSKYLVWSEDEQRRHFKSLVEKGYVKTERRGTLGRRWVWVNQAKIEADLDELRLKSCCGENPESG